MNKKWTQSAFWKNYGATIICFVLALCILGVGLILRGTWAEQIVKIKESKMEIVTKKQLEENKEAQTSKVVSQSMLKAVSDVDFSRKEKDDKLAAEFFKYSMEWTSYETYRNSRDAFKEKYPYIEESSYFLTTFFPDADRLLIRDASNDVVYSAFEKGLNIHFDTLTSYLIGVAEDGTTYQYFAEMMTHSDAGMGMWASRHMVALYDVTEDGVFQNVLVYVLTD